MSCPPSLGNAWRSVKQRNKFKSRLVFCEILIAAQGSKLLNRTTTNIFDRWKSRTCCKGTHQAKTYLCLVIQLDKWWELLLICHTIQKEKKLLRCQSEFLHIHVKFGALVSWAELGTKRRDTAVCLQLEGTAHALSIFWSLHLQHFEKIIFGVFFSN